MSDHPIPLGPVMVDLAGTTLTSRERERLRHPATGGVILFSRNFNNTQQLHDLTQEIHRSRTVPLLIAVDHEGGRVQRFRDGFTRIPPMRALGKIWDEHPKTAKRLAEQAGWVLGAELRACGVDFSFTPVLDLDYERCSAIGNRAFHRDTQAISDLAHALHIGLRHAGMVSVGKHFPGHGYVEADSHVDIPVDQRRYADLQMADLMPFQSMIGFGMAAVMPAHVIYPKVDAMPAGFSKVWLQGILRGELGFDGAIFSDDLGMQGASVAGERMLDRAMAALQAGCDMVLVCNQPDLADELLHDLKWHPSPVSLARLARMHGKPHAPNLDQLHENPDFAKAVHEIGAIGLENQSLPWDTIGEKVAHGKPSD